MLQKLAEKDALNDWLHKDSLPPAVSSRYPFGNTDKQTNRSRHLSLHMTEPYLSQAMRFRKKPRSRASRMVATSSEQMTSEEGVVVNDDEVKLSGSATSLNDGESSVCSMKTIGEWNLQVMHDNDMTTHEFDQGENKKVKKHRHHSENEKLVVTKRKRHSTPNNETKEVKKVTFKDTEHTNTNTTNPDNENKKHLKTKKSKKHKRNKKNIKNEISPKHESKVSRNKVEIPAPKQSEVINDDKLKKPTAVVKLETTVSPKNETTKQLKSKLPKINETEKCKNKCEQKKTENTSNENKPSMSRKQSRRAQIREMARERETISDEQKSRIQNVNK